MKRTLAVAAFLAATVTAPVAQAAGTDTLFVPGTGSTTKNAPDKVDAAWLDGGRWGTEPVYCICNSDDYPAKLGPGEGQASADRGREATVQFLLAHPGVINLLGGSQGGGVAYEAAYDPRLAGRELNVVTYSSMDAPTGMRARAKGTKNIPFVGIDGGVPAVPSDPTKHVTDIGHDWDPVFKSPKYQGSWAITIPTGIVGFIVYHGALGGPYGSQQIDYRDAKVETVDGRTVITLRDRLTPWGQLATIVVTNVAGPQAGFVFGTLIKPADDIAAGVLKAVGGYDEKGGATVGPTSAGEVQRAVQHVVKGFENAAKDFAAIPSTLAKGPLPKVTTPPTATESAPAPTAAKTAGDTTPTKAKPQVKPRAPKPSGNPVHDTIKTVQGAFKAFAPKPTKPKAAKPSTGTDNHEGATK